MYACACMDVCVPVCACVRACVRVCVCACMSLSPAQDNNSPILDLFSEVYWRYANEVSFTKEPFIMY